jgi:hypothetical protein
VKDCLVDPLTIVQGSRMHGGVSRKGRRLLPRAPRGEACSPQAPIRRSLALRHLDAVGAQHRHHSLRIIGSDYRLRAFAEVEDEPDVLLWPVPVKVEPMAEVGRATRISIRAVSQPLELPPPDAHGARHALADLGPSKWRVAFNPDDDDDDGVYRLTLTVSTRLPRNRSGRPRGGAVCCRWSRTLDRRSYRTRTLLRVHAFSVCATAVGAPRAP